LRSDQMNANKPAMDRTKADSRRAVGFMCGPQKRIIP
jgi:hypothetical protein